MNALDPFVVTTKEKLRFEQQFNNLSPVDGVLSGPQTKGFFLKSGLSPLVLGQIWALADTDADGKMNLIEFSIACKLISCKLRNVEIPKMLPPTLIASLKHVGTPIRTPTGAMSPTESYKSFLTQQPAVAAPIVNNVAPVAQIQPQAAPIMTQIPQQQQIPMTQMQQQIPIQQQQAYYYQQQPQVIPQQQQMAGVPAMQMQQQQPISAIPQQQIPMSAVPQIPVAIPQQIPMQVAPIQQQQPMQMQMQPMGVMPQQQQMIPTEQPLIMSSQPQQIIQQTQMLTQQAMMTPQVPMTAEPTQILPTSDSKQRLNESIANGVAAAPKRPSIPNQPSLEKAPSVPDSPVSDWAVPHATKLKYTQLFNQHDKTRCGFLTGVQARGILMQTKVPNQALAQIWALSDVNHDGRLGCEEFVLALYFCELFVTGQQLPASLPAELIPPSFRKPVSRSGSVSSQGAAQVEMETVGGGSIHSSFEDRRKENYDKGQAELERRRRVLEETAKREAEERDRKEREEAEKREKARIEAEQRKQEEIQREIQRQKELEEAKEEERKRELERKEQARKEMEKQRQLEWENQKLQELENERQKEQERLLKLKSQNQTLTIELESLSVKVKELSQKICDTRGTVTTVKSNIDEMRSVRDTCMSEQSQVKAQIKEQNAKLVQLSQEKSKMDAKIKTNEDQNLITNKQIAIKQLRDKTEDIKTELTDKRQDFETHATQKKEIKTELDELISNCETLYNEYDIVRIQVLEMKNNQKNDMHTSAWGASNDAWGPSTTTTAAEPAEVLPDCPAGYIRYRAIYDFAARNKDEVSFLPGDIILVPIQQTGEEGWLAGEFNGATGWFPETYVEKIDLDYEIERVAAAPVDEPVAVENNNIQDDDITDYGRFISTYPYVSAEPGDLNFEAGEEMQVVKKDGDWWTGVIGNRSGIFPANYVQPLDDVQPAEQQKAKFSAAEADADSEVSQINTQNVSDTASMRESRGLTASASLRAKKGEVASVIADYEATGNEQLSLKKGQLIMIRKRSESGWWEGELQSKGRKRQIGWFPASYVKLRSSGRLSGRSTPLSASEIIIDKVQALYPYNALNDDELSFEPDDIISVISKDESDWWKGELNGLTGLFPSNYVKTIVG